MAEKVKGMAKQPTFLKISQENHTLKGKGEKVSGRIQKFVSLYPKKNTRGAYQSAVYSFLDCMYQVKVRKTKFHVTDEERAKYEELAERYFSEERDYFEDLLRFSASMNGRAPLGVRTMMSEVKELLNYNGVEFTTNQLKSLSKKLPKGKMELTAEKDIEVETLRKMLTHADLKTKAVILTLASSGMRIGEAIQIKLSDIDLDKTPPQITVRGEYTKSGDTRITFISREAKETLQEWLKVRDRYLQSAQAKNRGLIETGHGNEKAIDDSRIFPFTDANFRMSWDNTLMKAGLYSQDESTRFSQRRVHGLRKFFRSQLALSCPHDIVEALIGHEGYLTEAYRRYSQKQLAEYYLKGEQHVTVMRGSGDIQELQGRLEETQVTVKGYKGIITEQAAEIAQLREDIMTVRRMLNEIVLQSQKIPIYEAMLKGRDDEVVRIKEDIIFLRGELERLVDEIKRYRPPPPPLSEEEMKERINRAIERLKEEERKQSSTKK